MSNFDNINAKDGKQIVFEWAKPQDWSPAIMLVWKTFMEFDSADYKPEGVKSFFEFISDDDLHEAFMKGTYQMLLAKCEDKIVGVASVRNNTHLSLLFVDGEYHRLGIGRRLLDIFGGYIFFEEGEKVFSVNASPYGVDFYSKCGFVSQSAERMEKGIRYTPMCKILTEDLFIIEGRP